MLHKFLIPAIIFIGIYLVASQGLKGGPEIYPSETAALLKGEPHPVVIDLRELVDYQKGHISGAISVPIGEFKEKLESLKLPKDAAVVLYATDDANVREITRLLYEKGYQGALTLKGGITAWRQAGYAVVTKP